MALCTFTEMDEWGEDVACGAQADYFDDLLGEPRCEYCRMPGSRRVTPWPETRVSEGAELMGDD